jgi:hypothetical protein
MRRTRILAALAVATCLCWPAMAQEPQRVRIAGTIEKLDGNVATVKLSKGGEQRIVLADNVQVIAVMKASVSDIKEGAFIGSGGVPQQDGSQKAKEVHIFSEVQRGTGEGFDQNWRGAPNGTMTNGTVGVTVTGVDGPVLTVKYRGGEKKIVVGPDTPIVRYDLGSKTDIRSGASIRVTRAVKKPDGELEATRVSVGRDGVSLTD